MRDERWTRCTRAEIAARGESLDLGLMRDASVLDSNALPDPAESAAEAAALLEAAADMLRGVADELRALERGGA